MMAALTNHLWQSTLFAVAAALLAFALRKNRADIRHWVWLTASVKFLVPLALLLRLGSALASTPAAPTPLVAPTVSVALAQFTEPFAPDGTSAIAVPARQASSDWVRLAGISVWILGFVVIALMRLRGWQRI